MSRSHRPIAIARRRQSPPFGSPWLVLLASVLAAWAAVAAAHAQGATPAPMPPQSSEPGPTTPPPLGSGDARGVIRPPASVDPGMMRKAPNEDRFATPVIPPPGTPGGSSKVVPK